MSWRTTKKKLGGYHCIENGTNMSATPPAAYELSIVGKYGEIWQYSSDSFVVICEGVIPKTLRPHMQKSCRWQFSFVQLQNVIKAIKAPKSTKRQLALMLQHEKQGVFGYISVPRKQKQTGDKG